MGDIKTSPSGSVASSGLKYRIRIVRADDEMQLYEFEYQMRRKAMTEEERIREDVEMEQHIKIATAEIINNRMKLIRERRDVLLARSDYYLSMPDIKITDEKKDEILKYRQELRDFPSKFVDGVYDGKVHILAITNDELLGHLPKL
jgi:hypothetical protein